MKSLTEVELDKTKPMVCCGCSAIGPIESECTLWDGWYRTKVIYLGTDAYGKHLYQSAAHCGKCMSEEMSWSITDLEAEVKKGAGNIIILRGQSEVLSQLGWGRYVFRPELMDKPLGTWRPRLTLISGEVA